MIVVDASVLTGFLLEQDQAVRVVKEELAGHGHEPLHAPEVVDPETLNALRKVSLRGWVTPRRATAAVADLPKVRLIRYPHEALVPRMWELRDQLTAYDASYVALAETLGDAVLLTADRGLATVAKRLLGVDGVRTVL